MITEKTAKKLERANKILKKAQVILFHLSLSAHKELPQGHGSFDEQVEKLERIIAYMENLTT